ncbi:uncharacterized protein LOC133779059 [Humulus lupulus]|uniref:uncharacterized protein LOC133779059 n=1 Tax=Humulus lupulus TaxID=3486 RepID=UPI002B414EEE|nr:uncharacterized protein LOC133779059 [Humulus lupulus]
MEKPERTSRLRIFEKPLLGLWLGTLMWFLRLLIELVDSQKWRALGLVDEMRTRGSHFTWTNKQANEDRIYSKLDRMFINEDWLDSFPHAEAVVNWEMLSDHCFCIIKSGAALNCGVKPFRFFNRWTDHDNFKETVMQSWCKPSKGHVLERIIRKLGRLKHVLRKFNKRTVDDVVQNYTIAKENYQAAQIYLQGDPHSTELQREERLAGEIFSNHARIYDSFLRKKSKVNWLRYGDDNNAYFHACLKQRRASNRITSFVNETGQLIERFEDVVAHFVNHFRKIMGSQSNASVPIQRSCFRYGNSLSLDQQICLIKPFTKKEVEDALFSISPIKISGPDWYGSGFKGALEVKKGLRQGDPISPWFFVLVMEYFTRLLFQASLNKNFIYHPKCKNLKIVNLCFADDLVIFCKGASNSVQIIKDCFTEFSLASGLSANLEKSQVFFGGLAELETKQLLNRLQFTEGCIPLKYLGVPLRTTKWKAGDCAIIIKKIQLKLHTWSSRHLSFAGRAQLINYVLLGIRTFWMSIFILPKSVIKEIDQLCRNFLWGFKDSNSNRSKMHLIAWDQVCLPKSLGGLGFKEGSNWNKVLLAKFFWVVSSKQDILWVKWVDSIYLKGQNFWEYKIQ